MSALLLTLVVLAAACWPPASRPVTGTPGALREVELTVTTGDGVVLPATLRVPAGAPPGLPGMVLVHGAGPGPREYYRAEAEAFARAGIVTLAYDKRTAGYSLTRRSYSQLADDAVAAAAVLRSRPEVDPARVGIWGLSEGGWVAPLAASRDPLTAFVVAVSANGVSPLRQHTWAERMKAEHAGLSGAVVDAYSRTFWRLVDGLGLFPEARYDPGPALRSLRVPVLGIWGALDRVAPPAEGVAAYRRHLDDGGNRHYTLRVIDGAEHAIRATPDGWARQERFATGYIETVGSWVAAAAAGRAPAATVSGTAEQTRPTTDVAPLAWWESAPLQLGALAVMVAGFGGFLLTSSWRRLRSGRRTPRTALLAAASGLVAAPGAPLYLGHLQAVSGGTITSNGVLAAGPVIAGRPIGWLALQLLAATAVAAGVAAVARREELAGSRHALFAAGALFVPWSLYWGLLLP